MARILIVDDESNIREVVREYCELNGYETDEAEDGFTALQKVQENEFDCIILDIMMPRMDGFTACREIRKISRVPVIMLSARQEEYDKLLGFELGVDDYVVKPFSPKELMARIRVILERSRHQEKKVLKFSGIEIDILGRSVSVDGEKVTLTPKEIDLLIYFATHPDIALSRQKLLSEVWNYDYYGDDRTVDSHVKMLRKNLGEYRDCIVTVRGMGYKFETR